MANVDVKAYVKYRVTKREGNKEVSQRFINHEVNVGEIDEELFTTLNLVVGWLHEDPEILGMMPDA
jgi:hypothetical protein